MDIKDVEKTNIHNALEDAKEKGTKAVLGDTRTPLEKASDDLFKKPSFAAPSLPSTLNKGSTPTIPNVKLRPNLNLDVKK